MAENKYNIRKNNFKSSGVSAESQTRSRHLHNEAVRKSKRDKSFFTKRLRSSDDSINISSIGLIDLDLITSSICQSENVSVHLVGIRNLRQYLCCSGDATQSIIDGKLITCLANALMSPNELLRSDAAWCLTNIATGDHEQTGGVLVAVPNVIQILCHENCSDSIKEQVCWIIGNIAGDCDEYRRILLANGCLSPLVRFLLSSSRVGFVSGIRTAAWTASNLARGTSTAAAFVETGEALSLTQLISAADIEVSTEVCWMFAFLTAKEESQMEVFLQCGLIEILLQKALSCDPLSPSTVPLVRCFGNLTSGPIQWIDEFFSNSERAGSFVEILTRFTVTNGTVHHAVLKESLWVVCNVLGGRPQHRNTALQYLSACGVDLLANVMDSFCGDEFTSQREALLALQNACLSDVALQHVMYGTKRGAISTQLVRVLKLHSDCETSVACLSIFLAAHTQCPTTNGFVLSHCVPLGLMDVLDEMQYGPISEDVGRRATVLADLLYSAMEQDEEDVEDVVETALPALSMGRGQHLARPAWMTSGLQ